MKIDISKNHIVCGDNLDWLKDLPDESVDLCYIDPPFFSNRNYEVIWGNGYELRSFGDRFAGGISHYIDWMKPRIELIHQKLKRTGSIFVHCDWHANHRLRVLLDDVFGENNFRNEIIWKRKTGKGETNRKMSKFGNDCDTILFYAKSESAFFESQYSFESDEYREYVAKFFKHKDEKGRLYASDNLASPSPRPNLMYTYKGYKPPKYGWAISKENMEQWDKEGRLLFPKNKDGRIRRKRYLDELKGKPVQSLWDDVQPVSSQDKERLGYPTQKPETLIKRIIQCASKEGDVVLDCFAGGGTTPKVCSDLKRTFIAGDVSPVAVRIMAERLSFDCPDVKFELKNLPSTLSGFKKIGGHKFAEMVCELMGWELNERKSGDGGIDGWDAHGFPIQVKNHAKSTGRDDIQKFYGALASEKKKRGVFVAWEFSKQAMEYIASVKQEHKVEIIPMKCEDVFKGLLIDESKQLELESLYKERKPKTWDGSVDVVAKANEHKRVIEKVKATKEKLKESRRKEVNKRA